LTGEFDRIFVASGPVNGLIFFVQKTDPESTALSRFLPGNAQENGDGHRRYIRPGYCPSRAQQTDFPRRIDLRRVTQYDEGFHQAFPAIATR
jgi:hypothetical protein